MALVNFLLHKSHSSGSDFDENLAFFSTKPSVLAVHPAVKNGVSKPAALSKFSVNTQAFL